MQEINASTLARNHAQVLESLDLDKPTIIFAAGGTSGHINPALAVAKAMRAKTDDYQILFCGNGDGFEAALVTREHFPFYWIEAEPFEFSSPIRVLVALGAFFRGRRQVLELMSKLRVKAVIGTGGFVCAPALSAAKRRACPRIIHEQNAYPGKSTRSQSRAAACVCVSYPGTERYFRAARKTKLTGNPVDERFFTESRERVRAQLGISPKSRIVLATGGSLGAKRLNEAVIDLAERLTKAPSSTPYQIKLVTGKRHYAAVKSEAADKFTGRLEIDEYLYDMPRQLAAADVVICRAGAGTLAELSAMGKPSILVPFPHAKGDHQTKNAKVMLAHGASLLRTDADLTGEWLKQELDRLFLNEARLKEMSLNAKALAQPQAALLIVEEILEAIGGGN